MSRRHIASNLLALYVVQGMQYVFPLLVLPILTRAIGLERYGVLSFWQSLAAVLVMVIDYGFGYSSIRAINQSDSQAQRQRIFWSTMWAKLILLMPATAILVCIAAATGRAEDPDIILATWLSLLGASLSPAWYFVAVRRNVPVASLGATASLLSIVVMFLAVHDTNDFHIAAFIQLGMPLVASLMMLAYLAARISPGLPEKVPGAVSLRFREGLPLFIMTIGAGAYSAFNPFLLGLVAPSTQVAEYALGERLARAAKNGVGPILTAMYPYAAEGERGTSETRAYLFRAGVATVGLSALIAVVLALFAPLAIWLVAGPAFHGAILTTRLLSINVAVITAGHLVGVQYLVARGKEALVTTITVVSAPIHIVAFLLAGSHFGAVGGAVAYVAIECIVTLAFVAVALKLRNSH